jgi:AcrR family transcriptional regulator
VPPTKERTPELRNRIFDAAIEVLATQGVSAVTTRRVAELAGTSPPAIYELFGDKAGLVRELFFEGFRRLLAALKELDTTDDPTRDLVQAVLTIRDFANTNPHFFAVMYAQPFDVYMPNPEERRLGDGTRQFIVGRVERCADAGFIVGDPVDIGHGLLGLAIGLGTQETAGWLGSTETSRQRRWSTSLWALISGLRP